MAGLDYMGSLALLACATVGSDRTISAGAVVGELSWMLRLGLPLVALVHVGIGSFLSMQSYFGGTFVEGTGAVVGVGLIRNVAPLMACLTPRRPARRADHPELRGWRRPGRRIRRPNAPASSNGRPPDPPEPPRTSRAARRGRGPAVAAGMVAGLVFGVWGCAVGTLVGWQVAQTMMGVSSHSFFQMFWEMLWVRDVVGLVVKGFALRPGRGGVRLPRRAPGRRPTTAWTPWPRPRCRAGLLRGGGDPGDQ